MMDSMDWFRVRETPEFLKLMYDSRSIVLVFMRRIGKIRFEDFGDPEKVECAYRRFRTELLKMNGERV